MIDNFGKHLKIDVSASADVLNDKELIEEFLAAAAAASGMHVIELFAHRFQPQGVTGFAVLEESHIAIHTWPERGYANVDVFTCGDGSDLSPIVDVLQDTFKPVAINIQQDTNNIPIASNDESRVHLLNWYAEKETVGIEARTEMRSVLHHRMSEYQEIKVIDTVPFGKALVLDNIIQATVRDEFIYHEMIVHPLLLSLSQPKDVLIIGGGDGGCLRRVLQHPVQRVVLVEIDKEVIDVCLEYIPEIARSAFDDPRVEVRIEDGREYVRRANLKFDAIIIDCTDPFPSGPSHPLFTADFYRNVASCLKRDGVLVTQGGTSFFRLNELLMAFTNLRESFPVVKAYSAPIPSYPGVLCSFVSASSRHDLSTTKSSVLRDRLVRRGIATRYYSPDIHHSSFVLPPFQEEITRHPERLWTEDSDFPVSYENFFKHDAAALNSAEPTPSVP